MESGKAMDWYQTLRLHEEVLRRRLSLSEMIALAKTYKMYEAEIQAQRESWVKAMKPTGDPRFD